MEDTELVYNINDYSTTYKFLEVPKRSDWKCYMFGNKPELNDGLMYHPKENCEPNWFVRWMMKICFDCTWIKEKQ